MSVKKRAEAVLFASVFFNSLVFFAPAAILVRTRWGITVSQFFVLQAVLSFGIFLFEIPCGLVTDKIGYRLSILVSQVLLCITRILFLIGGSFFLFAVEAVLEAVSISFVSGTSSAYLYDMYEEDEFMPKTAVMNNYGTAGFILSTVLFVPLNRMFGINGLIAATLISLSVSLVILLFLPAAVHKQNKAEERPCEAENPEPAPPLKNLIKSLCTKEVFLFFLLSALMSIASLVINFFYILKLQAVNLSGDWMSLIILGYSGIGMASPFIIKKLQTVKSGTVITAEFILIALLFFMLGGFSGYAVFVPMLLLPLFISLPGILLSDMGNRLIDKSGQQKNRAGFLSVLNQGANLFEILFLFFASAAGTKTVSVIFYLTAGAFLLLSAVLFAFKNNGLFLTAFFLFAGLGVCRAALLCRLGFFFHWNFYTELV